MGGAEILFQFCPVATRPQDLAAAEFQVLSREKVPRQYWAEMEEGGWTSSQLPSTERALVDTDTHS